MADKWSQRRARIAAGVVTQFNTDGKANAIAVRVIDNATPVYMGFDPSLTDTDFEAKAEPLSYGLISRGEMIRTFYLLAANAVDVMIVEVFSENTAPLLSGMTLKKNIANDVTVTATVGVKPVDLNRDTLKNIGVNIAGDTRQPWVQRTTSGDNASATATRPAEAGKTHFVTGYMVVLRGANAAVDASIELRENGVIRVQDYLGTGKVRGERIIYTLPTPLQAAVNTPVSLFVGAAGAGAICELNLMGYTI